MHRRVDLWRNDVDRLVGVWLDALVSISNDAGWEGSGLLSRIIEFGGEPPRGSGQDQSNVTLMLAQRLLRDPHPDYYRINPVIRVMLREHAGPAHALLAKNYYPGSVICPRTNRGWTDAERAGAMQQTGPQFRTNLKNAYLVAGAWLFGWDGFRSNYKIS